MQVFEDEPVQLDSKSCDDPLLQFSKPYYRDMQCSVFDLTSEKQQGLFVDSDLKNLGYLVSSCSEL